MAHRSLATRIWGPAAYALRRHPGPVVTPPPPPAAAARSRFVGTIRDQNDIGTRRRIDVECIRGDLKRYKIEDEIMRENIRWGSRFYKTLEWSSYVILSVSAASFTACEVIVRSRKDKGHVQPT